MIFRKAKKLIRLIFIVSFISCSSQEPIDLAIEKRELAELQGNLYERLQSIKDDDLKNRMIGIASIIVQKEADRLFRLTEQDTTETTTEVQEFIGKFNTNEELSMSYINGHKPIIRSKGQHDIEISIPIPFTYPFKINTIWKQIELENKKWIEIEKEDRSQQDKVVNTVKALESDFWFPKQIKIYYPDNESVINPCIIKGEFEFSVPSSINKYVLTQEDIGKKSKRDGFEFTLLTLENGFAEIEVIKSNLDVENNKTSYLFDSFIIEGKDQSGKFIKKGMLTSAPLSGKNPELHKLYLKLLAQDVISDDFSSQFCNEYDKKVKTNENNVENLKTDYFQIQFKGVPSEILITIYDYTDSKPINIIKDFEITSK